MKKGMVVITQIIDSNDLALGFMHRWIEALSQHAPKIHGLCLKKGIYNFSDNITVTSLGKERGVSRAGYILNFYKFIIPLIWNGKIDRIFIHMNEVYVILLIPFLPLIRFKKITLIWWKTRGSITSIGKIARFFVDHIATSSDVSFPISTGKKRILGHGIDISIFKRVTSIHQKHTIVAVGRMSGVKNYEDVIRATAILKKQYSDISLRIVGLEEENDYVKTLRKLITDLQIEQEATLVPACSFRELYEEYQKASIMVNSSDTDSMDKVVLEAMSCNVIPVTSNPAYEKMLEEYNLFVPKKDEEAMALTIGTLWEMSYENFEKKAHQMRDIVEKEHELGGLVKKIYNLSYEE